MVFDVSEYTLVFRRVLRQRPGQCATPEGWVLARPALMPAAMRAVTPAATSAPLAGDRDVEQVLTVRICSTLALEDSLYERFLAGSGVLPGALRLVARVRLGDAQSVETTRRRVQSLVMRAEVRHIADALSA